MKQIAVLIGFAMLVVSGMSGCWTRESVDPGGSDGGPVVTGPEPGTSYVLTLCFDDGVLNSQRIPPDTVVVESQALIDSCAAIASKTLVEGEPQEYTLTNQTQIDDTQLAVSSLLSEQAREATWGEIKSSWGGGKGDH